MVADSGIDPIWLRARFRCDPCMGGVEPGTQQVPQDLRPPPAQWPRLCNCVDQSKLRKE